MAKAKLIEAEDLRGEPLERWRELERRALFANPFQAPGFLGPAIRELGNGEVGLLVVEDGGEWLGAMPLWVGRGWHRLPLHTASLWSHVYHYLGVPLLAAEHPEDALVALLQAARQGAFLGFDLIPLEGEFKPLLERAAHRLGRRVLVFDRFERAGLTRKDGQLILPFKKKRRYELNRLERRLGEHLSAPVQLVDHSGDTACLEAFLRMEAAGWKGQARTALASDPGHAAFFRAIAEHFMTVRAWRLFTLEAAGRPLAMLSGIVSERTLYGFKITYDENFGQYSPGVLLHRATTRLLDEEGEIEVIDTCAYPTNETANRLYPDRVPMATLAIPAAGVKSLYATPTLRLATRLKRRRQSQNEMSNAVGKEKR